MSKLKMAATGTVLATVCLVLLMGQTPDSAKTPKDTPVVFVGESCGMALVGDELWGCSHYGGIWVRDAKSGQSKSFEPEWAKASLHHAGFWAAWCAAKYDGKVWVGNFWGLTVLDLQAQQVRRITDKEGLASNQALCMVEMAGRLWIGCENGLSAYDAKTSSYKNWYAKDGLPGGTVSSLSPSADGKTLWMATSGGLAAMDVVDGKIRSFTVKDGLPCQAVICVSAAPDAVWAGTMKGACRLNIAAGKVDKVITSKDGLPLDWIDSIAAAGKVVYIGTYRGLFRYATSDGGIKKINDRPTAAILATPAAVYVAQ